ncbi:MAG: phosphoglycerate kinase [Desulfuromonas sp.]|nr:MAG: phosphoglycerate kinase [Desulfuromonas sp.]
MSAKMTLKDIDIKGKRVLCRVDFNVPLDDELNITDDTRIVAALPTIQHILGNGGKLVLCSHLGRPKGAPDPKFSLAPVAKYLSKLIGVPVAMAPDCIGSVAEMLTEEMSMGDVVLLENLRFHSGETDNDPEFCQALARLGDVYVNDAFGAAHRAHASTAGITQYLQPAVSGLLLSKEIHYLGNALANPERPFVAILGGAKVSDKIPVIENLLQKVDALIIGGGMAYTFLKAKGHQVGGSLVEEDLVELSKKLMEQAEASGIKMLLPIDHILADTFSADAEAQSSPDIDIPEGKMALDIGSETRRLYCTELRKAQTVIWNGPMGVFEFEAFAEGTLTVARALADADVTSIIGGGDSVAAVTLSGLADQMSHISTGGGASLEFLEGKQLPGIVSLTDKIESPEQEG